MKVLIVGLGSIACKHIEALRIINESVIIYALRSSVLKESLNFINVENIFSLDNLKIKFFDQLTGKFNQSGFVRYTQERETSHILVQSEERLVVSISGLG